MFETVSAVADTTFPTKADARRWLATMEAELTAGRHLNPADGRERSATSPAVGSTSATCVPAPGTPTLARAHQGGEPFGDGDGGEVGVGLGEVRHDRCVADP